MIAYIRGKLVHKGRTSVIVDCNGIGYRLHISLHTFEQLNTAEEGSEIQLRTYFLVKEDAQTLFGFAEANEMHMFEHLIAVSGVGANTARAMLSALAPEELRAAIIAENVAVLKAVKGIGPKSAKRIILELKDKLLRDGGTDEAVLAAGQAQHAMREEALAALVTLGYQKSTVQKVLNRLLKASAKPQDTSMLIKMALKELSS